MALLDDTNSTTPKPPRSSKTKAPLPLRSSGRDSATLQTIQSLQRQIADLEAKEEERGELTKKQAAKLDELTAELASLKKTNQPAPGPERSTDERGNMFPWSL